MGAFMKKIGIVLAIGVGLLAVAAVAIWVIGNPNRHREAIQAQLEKQIGRKVTLGEMRLGLLPLRFQVANPVISEDPDISTQTPFVRAENMDVRVGLLPLLSGNIRVDSLELTRPGVELIKTKEGVWNFSTLGPSRDGDTASSTDEPGRDFVLNRLTIVDGQIGITNLELNRPRAGYDHIDLTLLNYVPGQPFSFDLAAHIQGEGAQEVRFKGEAGPVAAADPSATPFRGTLNLNEVGLDGLLKFLDTSTLPTARAVLSGQSDIRNESGSIASTGKFRLDAARFNDLDIGYPIDVDYEVGANIADGLVQISKATLQLGQTPLTVAGSVKTATTPAVLDLRIQSGDASIAEVARLASAFGIAFAPGTTVNGRMRADVQVRGTTTRPTVTGSIGGRDLEISGQGIPQPVHVQAVDLALSPSAIQSSEFNATSGKTTVVGRFSLLQYASNSPSIDLALRAPGATLPEIQSIAKAYGATGLDQITGEGTMNFNLQARGPLQSLTSANAMRALNGDINLDFRPLKVAGFDTAHELGELAGFASSVADKGSTDIVRMAGRILVRNGVAQTDDLRAELGIGNLSAAGTADLVTEALNLKVSAVLSKEFSDRVGASRAGGLMNAALSNSAGELVIPAIVTGTMKQPRFAPDLQAVAQMQRQRLLPTLDNPGAALRNVLGAFTGGRQNAAEPPAGQPPAQPAAEEERPSPVRSILDLFGGRRDDPATK
jgi:uncharacterized protein involved in outer membrane biogenesis